MIESSVNECKCREKLSIFPEDIVSGDPMNMDQLYIHDHPALS